MVPSKSLAAANPLWHAVHRARTRSAFGSRAEGEQFLALLAERSASSVEIHAFCLMSSHYHLLLRASAADVERFLQRLEGSCAARLFRGPFRTASIRGERHLVEASRYIHLNPVRAGLVDRPEEWPFSSYRGYLDSADAPAWLVTSRVLQAFGSVGPRRLYRVFVEEGRTGRLSPERQAYGVLDEQEFAGELRRRTALELPSGKAPLFLSPVPGLRPPLAQLERLVSEVFSDGLARGALVQAAQSFGYRLQEIASWMGYGSPASAARVAVRFLRDARCNQERLRALAAVRQRVTSALARESRAAEPGAVA